MAASIGKNLIKAAAKGGKIKGPKYGGGIEGAIKATKAKKKAKLIANAVKEEAKVVSKLNKRRKNNNVGPKNMKKVVAQAMDQALPAVGATTANLHTSFKVKEGVMGGDSIRLYGQERLGALSIAGPVTEGALLFSKNITPVELGTRLLQYSGLYERFRFAQVEVLYVPHISQASALANGGVVMAMEHDPTDPLPANNAVGVSELFTWKGAVAFAVFSTGKMRINFDDMSSSYYVHDNGDSDRFSIQCRVLAVANSALSAGNYGQFYLRYTLDMFHATPHIENILAGGFIWNSTGTGCTTTDPYGVSNMDPQSYGITYDHATGTFTFQETGAYSASGSVTGTGLSGNGGWVFGGTATRQTLNGTQQQAGDTTRTNWGFTILVTAPGQTFTTNLATAVSIAGSCARFAKAPTGSMQTPITRKQERDMLVDLRKKLEHLEMLEENCAPLNFYKVNC